MSRRPPEPALDAPVNEIVAWLRNMQTGTPVSPAMRKRVYDMTEHYKLPGVVPEDGPFGAHPHDLARWVENYVSKQVTRALAPAPDTH